jgi:trans-aconitate 2-methyltransferase
VTGSWDPQSYQAFDDHRARPFRDLVARVAANRPRRVVDLGCGPGARTVELAARWPGAVLEALDGSPEMVTAARENGVDAQLVDVRDWSPTADADVVVCNAVLQWVPEHVDLLPGWLAALPAGAWFAMQVPGNFAAPSHLLIRELAAEPPWAQRLEPPGQDVVLDPAGYAELMAAAGCRTDAWETTYLQRLEGDDPVLRWISGAALRPVRAALPDAEWDRFRAELAPRLRQAYPPSPDSSTWFPFRRVFAVAQRP